MLFVLALITESGLAIARYSTDDNQARVNGHDGAAHTNLRPSHKKALGGFRGALEPAAQHDGPVTDVSGMQNMQRLAGVSREVVCHLLQTTWKVPSQCSTRVIQRNN